jgi:phage tail sheath gpL-like
MGQYSGVNFRERINKMGPVAKEAHLGDVLYDILNHLNALLAHLDAASITSVAATETVTIAGVVGATDTVVLTFTNPNQASLVSAHTLSTVTAGTGGTATTVAAALASAINNDAVLAAVGVTATSSLGVLTISQSGTIGNSLTVGKTTTGGTTATLSNAGVLSGGVGTIGTGHVAAFTTLTPEQRVS